MAYLDHNATAPLRPDARSAIEHALSIGGNASSIHAAGRKAKQVIEEARSEIALLTGASPDDVVFTSGGTEANVLAIAGAVQGAAEAGERITRLFASTIEHGSVLAAAAAVTERTAGLRLEQIQVGSDGVVDLDALRSALREGKGRSLVAVMAANNETGVIQPTQEIASIVNEAGGLFFVDAVQSAGKSAAEPSTPPHYLSLSAHKLGGPQGVGALVVARGVPFAAQIVGGGQERGKRSGTENLPGIAGFGAAARACRADDQNRVATLRDRFERELARIAPDAVIFGRGAARLANTSNFAIPDIAAETAIMALDLDGVMVSSGAACSSGTVRPSHVLAAMGVKESLSRCALRVSFGWNSKDADVDAAIASLSKLLSRTRARAAA
jgi:cysteine desulfurase